MSSSALFYVALFGVVCLVLCDANSAIQKGADTAKSGVAESKSILGPVAEGFRESAHNVGSKLSDLTSGARSSIGNTLREGAGKIDPERVSGNSAAADHGSAGAGSAASAHGASAERGH